MVTEEGKILIISDVHGLIPEMNQFFHWLIDKQKQKISYVVSLGDFFKGRNFDGNIKKRDSFEDVEFFDQLHLPIFHLKGNEDLDIPDNWYISQNMAYMMDQEPFMLNRYKVLPIDYQYRGEHGDEIPKHPEYSEKDNFHFIFSHRPPFGLLDHTLHLQTHRRLRNIGSPLVRHYIDAIKPAVVFFGHLHFCNYIEYNQSLIICIDKLIRIGLNNQLKHSYGMIDPLDDSIEIFWKDMLFLRYSIPKKQILYLKHSERLKDKKK